DDRVFPWTVDRGCCGRPQGGLRVGLAHPRDLRGRDERRHRLTHTSGALNSLCWGPLVVPVNIFKEEPWRRTASLLSLRLKHCPLDGLIRERLSTCVATQRTPFPALCRVR